MVTLPGVSAEVPSRELLLGAVERVFADQDEQVAHASAVVPPWLGWTCLALLRYRARLDELIGRVGALADSEGVTRDGTRWNARDDQLWVASGAVTVACKASPVGDRFEAEPLLFRASSVATYIAGMRHAALPEQRLWRWAPGRRLLARLVHTTMTTLGAVEDTGGWFRLPPDLARFLGPAAHCRMRLPDDAVRRIAAHLGDPEIAAPLDDEAIGIVWARHAAWIRLLVDAGEVAVAEVLPSFVKGPALVRACDQLLARSWDKGGLRDVVRVLREHPEAPPSPTLRRLVAHAVPGERLWHTVVAAVAPYLLERGVDRAQTLAKVTAIARVSAMTSDDLDPPIDPGLLVCMIRHAPDAALTMIVRGLRARDGAIVCRVAGLLVTVADSWCIDELRAAIEDAAPHRAVLVAALAALEARDLEPDGALGRAVAAWRVRLDASTESRR